MADDPKPAGTPDPAATEAAEAPKGKKGKKKAAKAKGPRILSEREKFILRAFLFFFLLLLIDLLMIHPASNYLKKIDESIALKEDLIPKRLLILKHKDRILNDHKNLKPFFVEQGVTHEEETATFLREIEKVSKESNFFVTNINPVKTEKRSDTIYEFSLDVDGRGGLKEVLRFISAIENSNPAIAVSAFTLKPQNKEAEELKVSFSISKLGVRKNRANTRAS